MLKSPDKFQDIKLIDFGIATFCKGAKLSERIGTLHYAAPEILAAKKYGKKVDVTHKEASPTTEGKPHCVHIW